MFIPDLNAGLTNPNGDRQDARTATDAVTEGRRGDRGCKQL